MSSINVAERIDTLLALALNSVREERDAAPGHDPSHHAEEPGPQILRDALELLSELGPIGRRALESRANLYAQLSTAQQEQWLAQALRRPRLGEQTAHLDEHIHPSHIVEALREEPRRIQSLVLRHLPRSLREQSAVMLGLVLAEEPELDGSTLAAPAPEVLKIIRDGFLQRFIGPWESSQMTTLDGLSGVELRRLVKFLGAREIAITCRNMTTEALALFLRRFPAEDARMIAAHINARTHTEPGRAAFAESLMDAAISLDTSPEAMLNQVGIKLLAMTMVESSPARLLYTAQKIPFEAASGLSELVAASREGDDTEMIRIIAAEAEALAAGLKQPQAKSAPVRPNVAPDRARSQGAADKKR